MIRLTRRRVLGGLFALVVAAFLLVELVPTRGEPRIEIRSEGSDRGVARRLLTSRLEKLFPKGNGTWQLRSSPDADPDSQCAALSSPYRTARGRASTADYLFARWLDVRLAAYVYADAAAARNVSSAPGSQAAAVCEGQVVVEELRRRGYVVDKPHVFPGSSARISDGARSGRTEITSRYKGHTYDWDLDTTSVRRGRIVLVVGTLTARPFEQANQELASELAP
jgi:hypothetical protein